MPLHRKPRLTRGLLFLVALLVEASLPGCAFFDWFKPSLPGEMTPTGTPPAAQLTPWTSTPVLGTPTALVILHTVQDGETLWSIALLYGVSVEAIRQANGLTSDLIYAGQQLIIPTDSGTFPSADKHLVGAGETLQSIAAGYGIPVEDLRNANFMYGDALLPGQWLTIPETTPVPAPPYQFSALEGDLDAAYPLTLPGSRFTLHYAPGTYPAQDPQALADMIERNAEHIESLYQIQLSGTFDIYVAGTLYAEPNHHLRGRSLSVYRQTFFLHDGSGDAIDQQYISTHEMTHLFAWNTFGQPVSTMSSEGAAVYAGMTSISDSDYLPLETFCAAYLQQDRLPVISGALSFSGHIYDLQNYFAAGCFVKYLVEMYTPYSFGLVYHSGDWAGVYGKSLEGLEGDWRFALAAVPLPEGFDSLRLVTSVEAIEGAYQSFLPGFSAAAYQLNAYYELDQARLRLMRADFDGMEAHLANFRQILAAP